MRCVKRHHVTRRGILRATKRRPIVVEISKVAGNNNELHLDVVQASSGDKFLEEFRLIDREAISFVELMRRRIRAGYLVSEVMHQLHFFSVNRNVRHYNAAGPCTPDHFRNRLLG